MPARDSTLPSDEPARFSRESNTVKVENISQQVSCHEVLSLFTSMIGDIKSSRQFDTSAGSCLEIQFYNRDATKKALCMSGYTVGGVPVLVSPVHACSESWSGRIKSRDGRRNLYVLGLPLTLTKSDFANLFVQYGTVAHCVILATVDNASRRRGFVVMSSHEEAKLAMVSLSGAQINGHTLDISWAVVQRSEGFLDGGDRNVLDPSLSDVTRDPDIGVTNPADIAPVTSMSAPPKTTSLSLYPTPILLVMNLPSALFSQVTDLHPLFYPYGQIRKLELLDSPESASTSISGGLGLILRQSTDSKDSVSAIVEYSSISSADEAKQCLQRQSYAQHKLKVEYVRPPSLPLAPGSLAGYMDQTSRPTACRVDPFWAAIGFGVPPYMSPSILFNPSIEGLPCYIPAGPLHHGFPVGPPLFNNIQDQQSAPIAIHPSQHYVPSWPHVDADSRYCFS